MSSTRYLHLRQLPENLADNPNGLLLACSESLSGPWQQLTLETLSEQHSDPSLQWLLFIPGQLVLSTTLQVPAKQQRHLTRILPFLCEESLACDPADVHISAGRPQGSAVPVRIMDRQLLTTLLALLRQHGIELAGLYSESELLAASVQPPHALLWLADNACHWLHEGNVLTTAAANAPPLLQQLLTESPGTTDNERQLRVISNSTLQHPVTEQLNLLRSSGWQVQESIIAAELPSLLPRVPACADTGGSDSDTDKTTSGIEQNLSASSAINLLSGAFAPPRRHSQGPLPLRALATAAALLLTLTCAYQLVSGWYLHHRAAQFAQQSEALYREYFPADQRIIDIRRQTESHLRSANTTGSGSFFQLLDGVRRSWDTHGDQVNLRTLLYQRQRQEMLLDVEAASIAQLDQLQQSLGSRAELLSAIEVEQNGVRGRIRMSGE